MVSFHPEDLPPNSKFSILVPTWNNLAYLKLCIESIEKNSHFPHQIIVHINEGTDGTKEWVAAQKHSHTFSEENIGICHALNAAATLAKTDYIVFMNDDMYVAPDWDLHLWEAIEKLPSKDFFLSGTMIEPYHSGNPSVIAPHDFGKNAENFQEDKFLKAVAKFDKPDWSGATWPPNVVPRDLWDKVGGYSVEFSPGMASDPDFSMKLWKEGVRIFKGIGKSRVYHFGLKSTKRLTKQNGGRVFLNKWGISIGTFWKYHLRRGKPAQQVLPEPDVESGYRWAVLRNRLSKVFK